MKDRKSGNARKAIQVAVVAGLASGVAQAADSFFLNVPGVKGEALNAKYPGWIDVLSFSQAVGKQFCPRFVVAKNVDLATPALLAAAASASPYADMTLAGAAIGANQIEYLNVKMTNVIVSSSRQFGASGAVGSTEEIVLDPSGVTVTYTSIDNKTGGPGPQTTSTFACKLGG